MLFVQMPFQVVTTIIANIGRIKLTPERKRLLDAKDLAYQDQVEALFRDCGHDPLIASFCDFCLTLRMPSWFLEELLEKSIRK